MLAYTTFDKNSKKSVLTLKRVRLARNPFQGWNEFGDLIPGFSLRSNPGLELANAFGVISNCIPKMGHLKRK
jgi:hypothetical protein